MLATFINMALVLLGGGLGLLFQNAISERLTAILTQALGLCVLGIGISSALGTENMLCVIVCMVVGTVLGDLLDIERRLEGAGELLRARLIKEESGSRFTEGFVNASLLFCVGAMAITGSIEAGLNHNYEIIVSKGVIDGVTPISFAAAMGTGVLFSVVPLLIYQGGITLLAGWVGPALAGRSSSPSPSTCWGWAGSASRLAICCPPCSSPLPTYRWRSGWRGCCEGGGGTLTAPLLTDPENWLDHSKRNPCITRKKAVY